MTDTAGYISPVSVVDDKIAEVLTIYADAARAEKAEQEPYALAMPESAMYGYAGELARDTEAPLGYAYMSILTLFSGLGVRCHKKGEQIVPHLYTALIASPGFGKSRLIERLLMMLPNSVRSIVETSTPVSAPSLARLFAPGKDDPPIDAPGYQPPNCCLVLDELRQMMANTNTPGSGIQLASELCSLWYKDRGGSADKHGRRDYRVKLSILGALFAPTPEDFRRSFGRETQGGLYDRFVFVPGPRTWKWSDTWEPPFHDDIGLIDEPERPTPLSHDVEITAEALRMKEEWVDAAPLVYATFGEAEKAVRGRLGEMALRIAAISAAVNGDRITTRECMQAALKLVEWQENVRKVYKPSEGNTIDDECAQAIEEAFRQEQDGRPNNYYVRWKDITDRKHWYRKYAACLRRVKDMLIDSGLMEYKVDSVDDKTGNIKYDKRSVRWVA